MVAAELTTESVKHRRLGGTVISRTNAEGSDGVHARLV